MLLQCRAQQLVTYLLHLRADSLVDFVASGVLPRDLRVFLCRGETTDFLGIIANSAEFIYLFERERECMSRRGRERGRERISRRLCAECGALLEA